MTEVMRICNLCAAGKLTSDYIREEIVMGRMTPEEVAERYNMAPIEVTDHVYNHEVAPILNPGDQHIMEYYERAYLVLGRLDRWVQQLLSDDDVDGDSITNLTKLMKEYREVLNMCVLLDDKTKDNTLREVTKWRNNFESLQNILMTEVCKECQMRVIQKMKKGTL